MSTFTPVFFCAMIVLKRLEFDQKGGNFVTEQIKERKQAYAQQIAQHFHIPRWEQLPSIDLYMDQLLVYMNEHFGGYFPSSVEVLGNFRRLHFFLALMSHTTCPAILDFSTKILCPFWAFFY